MKIQETLDRLTQRGYACVVCEEVPSMNPYGTRAPPKERYVAAVVTPASPQYVVGAAEHGDDVAFDSAAPPPVVGVAATSAGYTIVAVRLPPVRPRSRGERRSLRTKMPGASLRPYSTSIPALGAFQLRF